MQRSNLGPYGFSAFLLKPRVWSSEVLRPWELPGGHLRLTITEKMGVPQVASASPHTWTQPCTLGGPYWRCLMAIGFGKGD